MARASKAGNGHLKKNPEEFQRGVEAIRADITLSVSHPKFAQIIGDIGAAEARRDALLSALERNCSTEKALPSDIEEQLREIVENGEPFGQILVKLGDHSLEDGCFDYWARIIVECAIDPDDLQAS
jgi:hypothetical protein